MHDELQPLRLTSRPRIQMKFHGYKFRAVGGKLYYGPVNETFHEFLEKLLISRLGRSWFESEIKKSEDERHIIVQWRRELLEAANRNLAQRNDNSKPGAFLPTGNMQAFMVLADDFYQLEHAFKTPRKILERLRDWRQFQGARYEILAASIFARCGFTIDFINDKTKKTPEFFATKEQSNERLAVEAKSRHRKGALHEPPTTQTPSEEMPKAEVTRLFAEALRQNPGNIPFFIFIDLNLPLTPGVAIKDKPWFIELGEVFDRLRSGGPNQPDEFTGAVFTNFGWHYYRQRGAEGGEFVIVPSQRPRYPVSVETWSLLTRALNEYGFVPNKEQHEKEVRAQYPEFGAE
jgi:hypothetical protein